MSTGNGAGADRMRAALEPLRAQPERAAILTDVDGTLAPIVERPEQVGLEPRAAAALRRLAERYGMVACISGRAAGEAKRIVGIEEIGYAGNHGLELLDPHSDTPTPHPGLRGHEADAIDFLASVDAGGLRADGLRMEDKGPIQALHWRGAEDEGRAEERAREIAASAEEAGLHPHWGRKVLELRPDVGVGKDVAVEALLEGGEATVALYAGDDRTDLDAFRRLGELRDSGALDTAICVGVTSPEAPPELSRQADLTVEGPAGWLEAMEMLAS